VIGLPRKFCNQYKINTRNFSNRLVIHQWKYNRQIEFIKVSKNQVDISKYFTKIKIIIKYTKMTLPKAKDFIIIYFLNHTSVIYIGNDRDFSIF